VTFEHAAAPCSEAQGEQPFPGVSWAGSPGLADVPGAPTLKKRGGLCSVGAFQDHIDKIRRTYTKAFSSEDEVARQIAVATYLIDRLALRAGNEKVRAGEGVVLPGGCLCLEGWGSALRAGYEKVRPQGRYCLGLVLPGGDLSGNSPSGRGNGKVGRVQSGPLSPEPLPSVALVSLARLLVNVVCAGRR